MTKYRQLLTSLAFLLLGILWVAADSPILAVVHFLASAFFLFGYFWLGPVIVAYGQAVRGNFISAQETLDVVRDVNTLSTRKRAYYFLTKGLIEESNNRLTSAEEFLHKARCETILPPKDEASTRVALARIYLLQGRDAEAAAQIDKIAVSKVGRSLRSEAGAITAAIGLRRINDMPRKSLFAEEEVK